MATKKWRDISELFHTTEKTKGEEAEGEENTPQTKQLLEVHLEKKHRGGKTAVVVRGYKGNPQTLKELGKLLKQKCGVGGSVKDGEIIIQGNVRDKVMELLKKEGYNVKRVGG